MALLKELVKKVILDEVIRGSKTSSSPGDLDWRVLVVDKIAMRIISACCSMHDIAAEGITIVEDIAKSREPLPYLDVIYFITPCEGSMKTLLQDLSSKLYRGSYIYFTEVCQQNLFNTLVQSPNCKKIKALKEVNIAFLPYESHVFSLDCPRAFSEFYGERGPSSESMEKIAEQIATLCATLEEYPAVRYRNADGKNAVLADLVEKKLKEYKQHETSMGEGSEKARSQLIILDRGFDCVSPLMHDLTFQAMAHDLLDIDNNTYTYETEGGEKTAVLDESDERWLKLKHKHIADVMKLVHENFKMFMESKNKSSKGGKETTTKDLALMMKTMPQHQKEISNLSTHIALANDCQKKFSRVKELCELEQNLALGTDTDGEKIRDHMNQLKTILLDMDEVNGITVYEKIRAIILYVLSKNGTTEDSLNRLMQHGCIDDTYRSIVTSVSNLGQNIVVNGNNKREIFQLERIDRSSQLSTYICARWTPILKDILEYIISDRLDERNFPFVAGRSATTGYKAPVSLRPAAWHEKQGKGKTLKKRPRLIVFIVGGVTFSEMRTAYEINDAHSNDWEVIIGSTQVMKPNAFLDNLKSIDRTEE